MAQGTAIEKIKVRGFVAEAACRRFVTFVILAFAICHSDRMIVQQRLFTLNGVRPPFRDFDIMVATSSGLTACTDWPAPSLSVHWRSRIPRRMRRRALRQHPLASQKFSPRGASSRQHPSQECYKVCPTLEHAAAENGLPVDFFVRVIWQESRFNALAVSSKGAQGIAQFMPGTAEWRGLNNPFDVIAALKASASYLGDLRNRYGNLGLAAAAYNAGPQRVQDWLLARGSLPKETRHYVQIVTGHSAEEWSGGTAHANLALPTPVPCEDVAKSMNSRTAVKLDFGLEKATTISTPQAKPGWGVQLIGSPSQASALASFQQLQRIYKIIGDAPAVRYPIQSWDERVLVSCARCD